MCKFTNRLFVFVVLGLMSMALCIDAAPARSKHKQKHDDLEDLLDVLTPDTDYDLHYDQRQKGEENFRLKLDGFFIGLTAPESSELMVLTDDLLGNLGEELLLGLGKSRATTSAPSNLLNYNRLDALDSKQPETIIVEIPAPKKEIEARQHGEPSVLEERGVGARTKLRIYQLLNLLRRSRKD